MSPLVFSSVSAKPLCIQAEVDSFLSGSGIISGDFHMTESKILLRQILVELSRKHVTLLMKLLWR